MLVLATGTPNLHPRVAPWEVLEMTTRYTGRITFTNRRLRIFQSFTFSHVQPKLVVIAGRVIDNFHVTHAKVDERVKMRVEQYYPVNLGAIAPNSLLRCQYSYVY